MFLLKALRQKGRCYALLGLSLLASLILPLTCFASNGKLTLTWNPNTESDIAGYRLYYGTNSRSYKLHHDVGLKTVYTLDELPQGTYYFVVTAYNKSGNESGYSEEVEYCLTPPPVVTQVSRTSGPAGTEIAISGNNLVNGTVVSFNGIPARIVRTTDTKVIAVVPNGVSSGPVTITTPGGSVVATRFTATSAQALMTLTIPGEGVGSYSTIGPSSTFQTGYATAVGTGSTSPHGIALLTYSQDGIVSTFAAISAAVPMTAARVPIEYLVQSGTGGLSVKTGISIVNAGTAAASLRFTLRNQNGNALPVQTASIAKGKHEAKFVDQIFAIPGNYGAGSLEISSDQPVLIAGIRLTVNQSGKLLMSAFPVSELPVKVRTEPVYFPRMTFGGGYQTTVLLMNTTDKEQSGEVCLYAESGTPISAGGSTNTYRIAPGGIYKLTKNDSSATAPNSGSIKVVPAAGSPAPVALELIGLTVGGSLISETSIAAGTPGYRSLFFVDGSEGRDSALAVSNPNPYPIRISLRPLGSDGNAAVPVPPNGSLAGFAGSLLHSAPKGFRGIVEMTSSEPFVALSLHSLTNENGEFLFANVPGLEEPAPSSVVFPQFVDGSGYQTELVMINTGKDAVPVQLGFRDNNGQPAAAGR